MLLLVFEKIKEELEIRKLLLDLVLQRSINGTQDAGAVELMQILESVFVVDGITTPVVSTSAHWFKNSNEIIDFKERCHTSSEYGRYGNPTTIVAENQISALEGAESTILMSSGMCASTVMMFALGKKGGHIITTTDCYRKMRIFIDDFLVPDMNITVHVIDPADMDGLKSALHKNNLISKLCHSKGTLVCVVLHSAKKFIGGHNDVLTGCISGSEEVTAKIHKLHHVLGGTLNPESNLLHAFVQKPIPTKIHQFVILL
ncbi:hypothetical protein C5167_035561 [Papaver somniferum]|uniref:Cystathionine gamma-synthase n=1 Tax=Papaver somniferum TaxID=3469 RepID=A0A4Y7KHM5_PAPSO|nr:hypothetical protein C5167_035561 [Papaver somniferum]